MSVGDLTKVAYVSQDFSTAVADTQTFLQTNYPTEFNDYVNSNLGQALIDIIGYAQQNLFWYLNRKVTDFYFPTAITPNSISKIARMLGYKPKGATGAIVSVSGVLDDGPYSFPVPINPGFQWNGPNGTIWEYRGAEPLIIPAGQTVGVFDLQEGATQTNNFVSDGTTNQVFKLLSVSTGQFVEDGSVEITVDGVSWTEAPIIPFDTINDFETNLLSSPATLKFGDSVQGNIPPQGAGIVVTYVATTGFNGRISSDGITTPVYGLVAAFQDIPITILQPNPSAGGNDPEDIRSIVVNAPLFQQTQNRAVTKADYDFLSNQYPNVASADAEIIRSVSADVTINTIFQLVAEDLAAIDNAVSGCSGAGESVSGFVDSVSGLMDTLYSYLDMTLSDTCKSNTVQVSVLSQDVMRRYVSPAPTTLTGLQASLSAVKDVVHTVVCVDGIGNVIGVDMTIEVQSDINANEANVMQAVSGAMLNASAAPFGLLIQRPFNESLYIWDVNQAIAAAVVPTTQIQHLNIQITGPAQYLDTYGNLICPTGMVLQAGVVRFVVIPRVGEI